MSIVQKATEEFKIPEVLERRTLPEEFRGSRFLDDEEVVISSLIDQNGHISRIFDFMLILTRIEKLDHRLLCLQLLKNYLSKEQSLHFVENGGFRILRRWMKVAEDGDNVDELRFILSVCEKLPFVESAVRHAEIGKSIKRLTKHISPIGRNVSELYAAANRVMELWKEQLRVAQAASGNTANSSVEKNKATSTNSSSEAKPKLHSKVSKANTGTEGESLASRDSSTQAKPPSASTTTTNPSLPSTEAAGKMIPPAKSTRLIDLIRRSEPIAANSASFSSTFPSSSASTVTTPLLSVVGSSSSKLSGEKRERRSLDMEASAKRLLESKQQRQINNAGSDSAMDEDDNGTNDNKNGVISAAAPISDVKPLGKGGLRSKTSAPKKKLNISWADETGGLLREVRYIEVEKIKSSVANYKSHKDMVKREKQMEKETYFTGKLEDEMITKTAEWRLPKRLLLPIDITDNMGLPADSKEKDIQQQRQTLALGVIYLDDSLIPDDPEEDVNMSDNENTAAVTNSFMDVDEASNATTSVPSSSSKKVHEISWYMEDETPVVEYVAPTSTMTGLSSFNANDNAFMFNPSQQQLQQQYFDQNGMMGNNNAMMMNNGNNMFQNHNNSHMMNNGNNVMNSLFMAANMGDLQSFFSCLPAVLQPLLDPHTVRILMQDPSLVSTLLLSGDILNNSAVNTYNVHVLQSSTSPTDYRMKINLPIQAQQQFNNNLIGGNNNLDNNNNRWGSNANSIGGMHLPVANMMQNQSQQQHPATKKSQVLCRYFNTARGCMNGDKCPFGHFGQGHVSSGNMNRGGGSGVNANGDFSSVANAAVVAAAAAASALMANAGYIGTGGSSASSGMGGGNMMNNTGGPGMMQPQRSNMPMMGTNVNAGGRMNRRRR